MTTWATTIPEPRAGDLLTRRQVAYMGGTTSNQVAQWARHGKLPELRDDDGHPRYRRADVEAFYEARAARR